MIVSGDAGFAKPDPRIFGLAAAALGVPPGRCLMVGDNRAGDAVGAQAAGMVGVWLNRRAEPAPDDAVPQIPSLAALPGLVAGGGARPGN